jgi:hypothetical protein
LSRKNKSFPPAAPTKVSKRVVKTLGLKSRIGLIPYDRVYAPGFDDMRRRKPLVEKTGTLREIQTADAAPRNHPADGEINNSTRLNF